MRDWISVNKRLPDVSIGGVVKVLISDGRCVEPAEFYLKSIDGITEDRTYAWRAPLSTCSEHLLWETITHWRPYPAPPSPIHKESNDE